MRIFTSLMFLAAALIFTLPAGCGGGGDGVTVHGSVTFDGKPVEKGYINFHPKDGAGRAAGGEISGGKFTVKNVAVGKCRVEVVSTPPTQATSNMDESIKEAKAKKGQAPSRELIPANADGNNKVHDITSGMELTLTLRTMDTMGPGPAPKK